MDGVRSRLLAAGCVVEGVDLDLHAADEAFETIRALGFASRFGADLVKLRGIAKEAVIWNVERGPELDAKTIARALAARSEVFAGFAETLQRFDVLAAPSAQVAPFPVEWEHPTEVAGV
ncbi:MAG: hypothetical protein ACYCSI_03470 [Solirubrobacteraceae bacterium]